MTPVTRSKIGMLIASAWIASSLIGCGGGKGGSSSNGTGEEVPKVSLVQGSEEKGANNNCEPCPDSNTPNTQEKIPEGAVRVSAFRILLGVHYCGATLLNAKNETFDVNVANFSEAYLGLNPLFCNVLRQSYAFPSNLIVTHAAPKDPSDKLLDMESVEFADNAKSEMGSLAFSKCESNKMGCGSNSVRVIAFTASSGPDAENQLCELILEVDEEGQRKTISAYVPWSKSSSDLAAQQSEVQTCSAAALAKQHGKMTETLGTLERPGGLLSDRYRLYALTLK